MTLYSAARNFLRQLDLSDIISRESAKDSSSLWCSHKPSVVTLFHNVHYVSLAQLHLIVIHRLVVVKGSESTKKINEGKYLYTHINSRRGLGFPVGHRGSGSGEVPGERGVWAGRPRAEDGLLLLIDGDVGAGSNGAVLEDGVSRRGSRGFR